MIPDSALIDGRMYPIKSIPYKAFRDGRFSIYGSLTLPKTLESIGEFAFYELDSITSVRLPETVTAIEDDAFAYSANLKEIYLGPQLKTIGNRVFECCYSLKDIYCYSDTPPSISYSAITEACTVHVKQSALAGFMADEDWSRKATFVADIPETTDVPATITDTALPRYYDLMGRPVSQDYKGLRISSQGKVSIAK